MVAKCFSGAVIISTIGECSASISVSPVLKKKKIHQSSTSTYRKMTLSWVVVHLLKVNAQVGSETPNIQDAEFFKNGFNAIQKLRV